MGLPRKINGSCRENSYGLSMENKTDKILTQILLFLLSIIIYVVFGFLYQVYKGKEVVRVEDVGVFGIRYEMNYGTGFYIEKKDTVLPVGSREIDGVWYTPEDLKKYKKR